MASKRRHAGSRSQPGLELAPGLDEQQLWGGTTPCWGSGRLQCRWTTARLARILTAREPLRSSAAAARDDECLSSGAKGRIRAVRAAALPAEAASRRRRPARCSPCSNAAASSRLLQVDRSTSRPAAVPASGFRSESGSRPAPGRALAARSECKPRSASSGLSLSDLDPEATATMVARGPCACWPTKGLLARGPPSTRARERFARVRSTALRGHVEASESVETKDASRLSGQTSGVRPGSPRALSRAATVRHSWALRR